MKSSAAPQLVIEPLTMSRWSAFADLLDHGGPAGRAGVLRRWGSTPDIDPWPANRADMRKAVKQGPPPGLLALRGQLAVRCAG